MNDTSLMNAVLEIARDTGAIALRGYGKGIDVERKASRHAVDRDDERLAV